MTSSDKNKQKTACTAGDIQKCILVLYYIPKKSTNVNIGGIKKVTRNYYKIEQMKTFQKINAKEVFQFIHFWQFGAPHKQGILSAASSISNW